MFVHESLCLESYMGFWFCKWAEKIMPLIKGKIGELIRSLSRTDCSLKIQLNPFKTTLLSLNIISVLVAAKFCIDRRYSLSVRTVYFPWGLAQEWVGVCGVSFVSHTQGISTEGAIFQLAFGNSSCWSFWSFKLYAKWGTVWCHGNPDWTAHIFLLCHPC